MHNSLFFFLNVACVVKRFLVMNPSCFSRFLLLSLVSFLPVGYRCCAMITKHVLVLHKYMVSGTFILYKFLSVCGVFSNMFIEIKCSTCLSKSGWPSGPRRQTQVLVLERGRGFKPHF